MKKIFLMILITIVFPARCLAQAEESFALIEWISQWESKLVVLDLDGGFMYEKQFIGDVPLCVFVAPSIDGWLVKGCTVNCGAGNWAIKDILDPYGTVRNEIYGLGPGPFYKGLANGNFIAGNVYTGDIDLYDTSGSIIGSTNAWAEEDGWSYDYVLLGDCAGLVNGGFVVPPEGGYPTGGDKTPYLYFYDNNLNLIDKVNIEPENIRLFHLTGLSDGSFVGTCGPGGNDGTVESLCHFDSGGSLIETVAIPDGFEIDYYTYVHLGSLADGRLLLTEPFTSNVWIYDFSPEELSFSISMTTADNPPEKWDLSGSGLASIASVAGNMLSTDSDGDDIPNGLDNCPYHYNPGQEDPFDGDGVGYLCDNCSVIPNGPNKGTCTKVGTGHSIGDECDEDSDCGTGGECSMDQEDTYPPQGNNCGDACECEADMNADQNVDSNDNITFNADFGRNLYNNPCSSGDPCDADYNCDHNVDSNDNIKLNEDFGRNIYNNPCPLCPTDPWCVY